MAHLFEKGRKIYKPTTEPYGRVLLLQVGFDVDCHFFHQYLKFIF